MRRSALVLASLLATAPSVGLAQATLGDGQVVPSGSQDAFVNVDECSATTASIGVIWDVRFRTGTLTVPTNADYEVFASNKAPTGTGDDQACAEVDGTDVKAGIVATFEAAPGDTTGRVTVPETLLASAMVTEAGYTCSEAAQPTIYLCVHLKDASGNRIGFATGTFKLSVLRPDAPTLVSATPGDRSVTAKWNAPAGGAIDGHWYAIEARAVNPADDAVVHTTFDRRTTALEGTIEGLRNAVRYNVSVRSYSEALSPSTNASNVLEATPNPSDGFWQVYDGVEQGGCASGPGGALALLGVAALVAVSRRRK